MYIYELIHTYFCKCASVSKGIRRSQKARPAKNVMEIHERASLKQCPIENRTEYAYVCMHVHACIAWCAETKTNACLRTRRMLSVFDHCEWHAEWRGQENTS